MKLPGLLIALVGLSMFALSGCSTSETVDVGFPHIDAGFVNSDATTNDDANTNPGQDAGVNPDATGTGQDATPAADTGVTAGTVASTIMMKVVLHNTVVSIDQAVVTATIGGGTAAGTFYIQDMGAAGPGLAVFRRASAAATAPFPAVGDIVKVTGKLTTFDGQDQLGAYTGTAMFPAVTLTVENHGAGGTVSGGAYAPAGTPIPAADPATYSHALADNHSSQFGNTIQFAGPLTVTSSHAFINTSMDHMTTHPEGFEITGGLWVDDSHVFAACLMNGIDLSHGIRGVWDRYQDFYAGTSANPAPVVPVLIPLTCADLNPH